MKVKKTQNFSQIMLIILTVALIIIILTQLKYPQDIVFAILMALFAVFILDTLLRAYFVLEDDYILRRDGIITKKIRYSNIIKIEKLEKANPLGKNAILIYLISKKNTFIRCYDSEKFLIELNNKIEATPKLTLEELKWDKFVDEISNWNYNLISKEKKSILCLYWYNYEIQNGGHLQLFENLNDSEVRQVQDSLRDLSEIVKNNFENAEEKFRNKTYNIIDLNSFSEVARNCDPYKENDEIYTKECESEIKQVLKKFVQTNY